MPAWGWIAIGAALLGAELLIPADFFLVFLGLAALVVGLVGLVGPSLPAWVQWTLFAVLAVISLVGFRRRVRARFIQTGSDPRVDDTLAGEVAVAREALAPGAIGKVELRGSVWNARNAGRQALAVGQRARVVQVEGLVLQLRAEAEAAEAAGAGGDTWRR
jgi:membrane protein implicated in regulation of membrane protease activity